MADAPEKILALIKDGPSLFKTGTWEAYDRDFGATPYIRADLVNDLRKALEGARESLEIFADCVSDHTQIRQDISDDLAKIDAALARIADKEK